ncbi:molybdenum cofactor guanylyltransferase [Aeromicrobium sp. CF4.19]|uniref:molybdenum cofactor guanylyltransferase n=1 Tax=Aeromicrobium sp. CF4.19 TaxID=3373082 RepID=UPI003EE5DEEB
MPSVATPAHDAVVLAGGQARRLGGIDKVLVESGGRTLLATAVAAATQARDIVVVGPRRDAELPRVVRWTRESPPFAGPVAGLAAGLAELPDGAELVLLLAADLPHADVLTTALLAAPPSGDARVVVDADGRAQWTASLLRRGRLATALRELGDPTDASLRRLFSHLEWEKVGVLPHDDAGRTSDPTWDVDTPDDLPDA